MATGVSEKTCDYVFVYGGEGTNPACVHATRDSLIKLLGRDGERRVIVENHPDDFSSKCLQPGAVLVVSGKDPLSINEVFERNHGMERISSFIKGDKGAYVGIGAGAVFGSRDALGLTNAPSVGAYTNTAEVVEVKKDWNVARNRDKNDRITTIRWAGSDFSACPRGEQLIATFENYRASIAALKPKTNAFLCHIHPEFQITRHLRAIVEETGKNFLPKETEALLDSAEAVQEWFKKELGWLMSQEGRPSLDPSFPFEEKELYFERFLPIDSRVGLAAFRVMNRKSAEPSPISSRLESIADSKISETAKSILRSRKFDNLRLME